MFWLISVFIITSKKDERTEADRSVCFIWFFSGLFLFLYRVVFMPAKPMWKLYLVWAVLSSVTLLYVISNRCNVMSTIKTHTHTHKRHLLATVFFFVFAAAFYYLNLPRRLNTSKWRWKSPGESRMASRLPSLPLPVWNAGRCFWILTRSEDLSAFLFFCVPRRLILGAAPRCHQTWRSPPGFYFRVGILAALVWCGLMKTHKKKKKNHYTWLR